MKQVKEFDCVQMKTEIQERLLREVAELGEDRAAHFGANDWFMTRSWALRGSEGGEFGPVHGANTRGLTALTRLGGAREESHRSG